MIHRSFHRTKIAQSLPPGACRHAERWQHTWSAPAEITRIDLELLDQAAQLR